MALAPILTLALLLGSLADRDPAKRPVPKRSALPALDCVHLIRGARIAEQLGQHGPALDRLLMAAEECPDRMEPMVELMSFHRRHALLSDEQAQSVQNTLNAWLADPQRPVLPATLGYLVENPDLDAEQRIAMLDAVQIRLERAPGDPRWVEAAAALNLRLQRYEAARELFGKLLGMQPGRRVRFACIELDRRLERWDDVVTGLQSILAEGQADPGTAMAYIEALGKAGRYEDLVAQVDSFYAGLDPAELAFFRPLAHEVLRQAAWDLRDRGQDAQSEKLFRRLVAENPKDREAQATVLYLYSSEQEQLAHLAELEQKWSNQENPLLLLERGGNLLAGGDPEGAIELLRRASAALPDHEFAWFNLGLAAYELERWDEAEQALKKAGEINPDRALAFLNRGAALSKLNRCEEAVTSLERALAIQSELYQAHYYLYACHVILGNKERAAEALEHYEAKR